MARSDGYILSYNCHIHPFPPLSPPSPPHFCFGVPATLAVAIAPGTKAASHHRAGFLRGTMQSQTFHRTYRPWKGRSWVLFLPFTMLLLLSPAISLVGEVVPSLCLKSHFWRCTCMSRKPPHSVYRFSICPAGYRHGCLQLKLNRPIYVDLHPFYLCGYPHPSLCF